MSGQYTNPDTTNYILRLTRSVTAYILEDKEYNIFRLKDRLLSAPIPDFGKHCGTPKLLKEEFVVKSQTSNEGRLAIAGHFTCMMNKYCIRKFSILCSTLSKKNTST